MTYEEAPELKRFRTLVLGLLISGAFNIFLLWLSVSLWFKDPTPAVYFEAPLSLKAIVEESKAPSNAKTLTAFKLLSKEQLYPLLKDRSIVENGFTNRVLALAALTHFHYFNLSKAVHHLPKLHQLRSVKLLDSQEDVKFYIDLTDQHFDAIIHFAETETWPLTSQGLFFSLQKDPTNGSLKEAFVMTPEFLAVETLFSRAKMPVSEQDILNVLLEGEWAMLQEFSLEQKPTSDVANSRRQRFLLHYIENKSKAAALLLLKLDASYAVKKLDDHHVLLTLEILEEKNPYTERFARALLANPRSDLVWKLAATRLYQFANEPVPEKFDHQQALAHFFPQHLMAPAHQVALASPKIASIAKENPQNTPSAKPVVKAQKPLRPATVVTRDKLYIVQEGDSLWKISRRFKVNVDVLRQHNRLQSDFLKPGTPLRIPIYTAST